jgi:uncharacterized protein YuzE
VILREDVGVAESDQDEPGFVLDYDAEGNLVSLEILDASKRVTDTRRIQFQNHADVGAPARIAASAGRGRRDGQAGFG